MGKTYKRNSDDAEYYKSQKLQREQQQRRKKQRGRDSFDREDSPSEQKGGRNNKRDW